MNRFFRFFSHKSFRHRVLTHNLSICSHFDFEFAEIFVIDKAGSRLLSVSVSRGVDDSPIR